MEAFVNSQLKPVYMVIRHKTSSSVIEFPLIKSSNVNKKNILAMKLKQKSNKNASTIEAEINIIYVYIVSYISYVVFYNFNLSQDGKVSTINN